MNSWMSLMHMSQKGLFRHIKNLAIRNNKENEGSCPASRFRGVLEMIQCLLLSWKMMERAAGLGQMLNFMSEAALKLVVTCFSIFFGVYHRFAYFKCTCESHRACSAVVIALRFGYQGLVTKVLGSNPAFSTKHVTCHFMVVE